MGTIQIDGSTPKLTIGNATAEDATILYDGNAKDFYIALDDSADKLVIGEGSTVGTNSILTITDDSITIGDAAAVDTKIVFDGNAQDFYIALDDSADDLLIGLGSTVGTTPAIAIDENLKVNIPVTTASTSASTGSLTTGGGAGIGADLYVGDDVYLITDSAVLGFGADKDTTLTHTDGTGLTLNSTNKLCFNDTSQYIQGASNAILDIAATDEIELTATLVDVNANLDVSGTYTGAGLMTTGGNIVIPNAGNIGSASDTDAIAIASNGVTTFSQAPVFPDGSLALADLDIDGGTEIGAAIVDADLFIIDDGAGGTNRKCLASRIKTYAGGGIDELDDWYLTTDLNMTANSETFITANWARKTNQYGAGSSLIGTGMSESSGVFTFPSTGYWWIHAEFDAYADSAAAVQQYLMLQTTANNSSFGTARWGFFGQSDGHYNTVSLDWIYDVTDTTNRKLKVKYYTTQTNNLRGDSGLMFAKLAGT